MPINGLVKKASKTKSRVNGLAMPRKFHESSSSSTNTTIDNSCSTARGHDISNHQTLSLAAYSAEDVGIHETMQISYNLSNNSDKLPSYPVADTIALILILVNIPNILITAIHVFFTYKEHTSAKLSGSTITTPPLFLILFIDAFLVLLTSIVLPQLRNLVTDASHVIIAKSLSGARWRSTFPIAIGFIALRLSISRSKHDSNLENANIDDGKSLLTSISYKIGSLLARSLRLMTKPDLSTTSSNAAAPMDFVRSAIAIHIFSLGFLRMSNWIRSDSTSECSGENEHSHHMAGSSKTRRKPFSPEYSNNQRFSIWNFLLRFRADTSSKRHELTETTGHLKESNVSIGEIAPRYVVFVVRTSTAEHPSLILRVNGLPWEAKIVPLVEDTHRVATNDAENCPKLWTLYIDNLSPKTEYDFSLEFKNHLDDLNEHRFAICTSAREIKLEKRSCDPYLLPALNTNMNEEPIVCADGLTYPDGPLSPVTTLEETIANATTRLEEKRSLMKRTRKENAKKLQLLQREVDHLVPRISGGIDKNEQRMQGRMLSLQTEIKRIQDSIDEMESEKQHLTTMKEGQYKLWLAEKAKRDTEATILDTIRQEYNSEKAKHQKRLSTVEAEALRIRAKADKLSLRRTKIQQDLDRISNEQDEVLNREYRERVSDRECLNKERLQLEAQYLKAILDVSQRAELLELYGNS